LKVIEQQFLDEKIKYHLRIVLINVARKIVLYISPENKQDVRELKQHAVEILVRGCKDSVSNVRLASTESLIQFIANGADRDFKDAIEGVFKSLGEDDDEEVKNMSSKGLSMLLEG